MKRLIDIHLLNWKSRSYRKPLILGGARQVGKTYAVRELAKTFDNFVEVNFEDYGEAAFNLFEKDLNAERLIQDLIVLTKQNIVPGKTLLFFDEVQGAPRAIIALRYFYEKMPELHVIAAGSLLDFAIQQVGVPVGRVTFLYMNPLSFIEFLWAMGYEMLVDAIMEHGPEKKISEVIHTKALELLGQYLAVGGMPEAVQIWKDSRNFIECSRVHHELIAAYRQDFDKYAKKWQIKYLNALFNYIPLRLGKKFKYSEVPGGYQKRELAPALDLLIVANVVTPVFRSAGNGIPLGAEADPEDFKLIFLDVGLAQAILGLDAGAWIINPLEQFVNKGELVEAFIGQELLAYASSMRKGALYYWQRMARGSQAEVDYLIQKEQTIIPIEVKSSGGTTLKSMQMFLESHPQSPYGIRFSTLNYSVFEKIHSYPLYAVACVMQNNPS